MSAKSGHERYRRCLIPCGEHHGMTGVFRSRRRSQRRQEDLVVAACCHQPFIATSWDSAWYRVARPLDGSFARRAEEVASSALLIPSRCAPAMPRAACAEIYVNWRALSSTSPATRSVCSRAAVSICSVHRCHCSIDCSIARITCGFLAARKNQAQTDQGPLGQGSYRSPWRSPSDLCCMPLMTVA